MAIDRGVREPDLVMATVRVEALTKAVYWAKESDAGAEAMAAEMEKARTPEHEQRIMATVAPLVAQGVANGLLWAAIAEAAKD